MTHHNQTKELTTWFLTTKFTSTGIRFQGLSPNHLERRAERGKLLSDNCSTTSFRACSVIPVATGIRHGLDPLQLMCGFNPVHFNPFHFNAVPTERALKENRGGAHLCCLTASYKLYITSYICVLHISALFLDKHPLVRPSLEASMGRGIEPPPIGDISAHFA
jgi:hypothetical protein